MDPANHWSGLAQRDSRYGAFVAGFANLRGWLILRGANRFWRVLSATNDVFGEFRTGRIILHPGDGA